MARPEANLARTRRQQEITENIMLAGQYLADAGKACKGVKLPYLTGAALRGVQWQLEQIERTLVILTQCVEE